MFVLGFGVLGLVITRCLIIFIIQRNHLLISLMALEGVILILVLGVIFNRGGGSEIYIIFRLLSFAACEASLGLACLVACVFVFTYLYLVYYISFIYFRVLIIDFPIKGIACIK